METLAASGVTDPPVPRAGNSIASRAMACRPLVKCPSTVIHKPIQLSTDKIDIDRIVTPTR